MAYWMGYMGIEFWRRCDMWYVDEVGFDAGVGWVIGRMICVVEL